MQPYRTYYDHVFIARFCSFIHSFILNQADRIQYKHYAKYYWQSTERPTVT